MSDRKETRFTGPKLEDVGWPISVNITCDCGTHYSITVDKPDPLPAPGAPVELLFAMKCPGCGDEDTGEITLGVREQ